MERGKYEDWQAAAVMQRLQRLPVIQWGELQAIESFLSKSTDDTSESLRQLSRLERAVEQGKVTSFDFEDVMQPVRRKVPDSPSGHELALPLSQEKVKEVVHRAQLLADRAEIPDETFADIQIDAIVRQAIKHGANEGSF